MVEDAGTPRCSTGEEIASSIIHGIGALLAVAGLVVLTAFARLHGSANHVVACSIFGLTLILLYTASTLYHSLPQPRAKAVFGALDHSAIFLLIAGTYTPFSLVNLRGPWGWSLLGVVWGLAIVGIVLRVALLRRPAAAFVGLYIGMGWCVVVAVKPLLAAVAPGGILLLVSGGLVYTAGVAFYVSRRLPYHHAIWHAFVLVGSTLHYFAVLFYVIPWVSLPR
jgi:hemolysin III